MAYGLGASVVIIGALFKILHWKIGPLDGSLLLAIGLITEAIVFAISAFEPVEDEYDWSLVYPELANIDNNQSARGVLSKKLDAMLKEARIDSELLSSLGKSIRSFEGAAKSITPTTDAMHHTKKYAEELLTAAAQMESLNSLYKAQVEAAGKQATINEEIIQNADVLKTQMESLVANLSSLNEVYGNMLSAMGSKS